MNIKRYFGRTNKEALAAMRRDLGTDAVVVRNRAVDGGVELLAMGGDSADNAAPPATPAPPASSRPAQPAAAADPGTMSTLKFQQHVQARIAQREEAARTAAASDSEPQDLVRPQPSSPQQAQPQPRQQPQQQPQPQPQAAPGVIEELRELRRFVAEQVGSLAWLDGVRRSSVQSRLLAWLLGAGFSSALARVVLERIPADWSFEQAQAWIPRALAHNLNCDHSASPLARGGVFALVGPTGVGKTTTTAKLAARFALEHGPQSLGLVTVDAYRIGGRDQLRSFGEMIGVPVHVAHDAATLADLLRLFERRKLVLIDTAGLGQRDQRVGKLLESLSSPAIRRLVVVSAAAQAETLDDVLRAYRASAAAGVILSKIDEAARIGGAIDCVLRHRLRLVGVADGQRVPEDWHLPDAAQLVDRALAAPPTPAFALRADDVQALSTGAALHV